MRMIRDWLNDRALEKAVAGYEAAPEVARFGRGTLRMVVSRLRPEMSPGEILSLLTVLLELIRALSGVVDDIVEAVRRRRQGV